MVPFLFFMATFFPRPGFLWLDVPPAPFLKLLLHGLPPELVLSGLGTRDMSVLIILDCTPLLLQGSPDKVALSVSPQGTNEEIPVLQLEFEGYELDCDEDSADEILLFFIDGNFPLEFFEELACLV